MDIPTTSKDLNSAINNLLVQIQGGPVELRDDLGFRIAKNK